MTFRPIGPRGCVAVLVVSLWAAQIVQIASVRVMAQDVGTEAQRESGKKLYAQYCSQCHGDKGDGEGYATPHLYPRPRNFTSGKFKVRTTPNGALPTHQDLVNIIRRGMPYTSMPAWPALSDQQVSDLAYFVTTFSPHFTNKGLVPKPVELSSAPGTVVVVDDYRLQPPPSPSLVKGARRSLAARSKPAVASKRVADRKPARTAKRKRASA